MATAKKTTKPAETVNETVEEPQELFEEFRDRAIALGGSGVKVTNTPFVLGEEHGFDPSVELPKPGYKARTLIVDALQRRDILSALRIVLGREVDRVLDAVDAHEEKTGTSGDLIVTGILIAYMEHFYGKGVISQAFRNLSTS